MEQGFLAPNPQPGSLRKGGLSQESRLLGETLWVRGEVALTHRISGVWGVGL